MTYFLLIVYALISICVGAIPTGFLLARAKGIDIRQKGSGNIGATNVTRSLGLPLGILTLVIDVLKAFLTLYLFKFIYFKYTSNFQLQGLNYNILIIFYSFLILSGNIFNPFLGFKGGKGVATSSGILLFLDPVSLLFSFIIFFIVVLLFRYISLGSILAAVSCAIFSIILKRDIILTIGIAIIAILVIIRHRQNILRLINKTESKFSLKKEK
ncbi:MAG TPA: glycerol-3-phosphate 1-O-acyltransferase PlsY [Exilispira sp.]|nr:glycerol-3-phosphate 1-O-acyltransferase PlsY [Exilispira sp.]